MKTLLKFRQGGFAIMESLFAFLLLGAGVAALLYLQGNLMSSSSLSKAHAEAMELDKDRTEMLHNFIQKDQFISVLNSAQSNEVPVTGKNATFAVSYKLENSVINSTTNPPKPEETQLLTVTVSWIGSDGDSEEVSLETKLYFLSPVIASSVVTGGDGDGEDFFPLISPLITGEEGEHPSTKTFASSDIEPEEIKDSTDSQIITLNIKTYYNTLDDSSLRYGNVELIGADGEVKLTSFGGIFIKIQGEILINSGANTTLGSLAEDLQILASPPSYCLFPICDGGSYDSVNNKLVCPTGSQKAKYVCYVPGDCTHQDQAALEGCPPNFVPIAGIPQQDDGFYDLNGGWYGRVGNFGIAIHPDDIVCTADTVKTSNLTPSREYVTQRCSSSLDADDQCPSGSITHNEGINQPFDCQTFIIARKNQVGNNDPDACSTLAATNYAGLELPPEQIKRGLVDTITAGVMDAPNVVLSVNSEYCP